MSCNVNFCMDTRTQSDIQTIIKAIKTKTRDSAKKIQQILQNDKDRLNQIPQWKDKDGLNLVHYIICYDRPDVLILFMKQTDAFSSADHQPDISPYAHLAATVGAAGCLDIILTVRPQDYFETFLPKHTIVLPAGFPSAFLDVVKGKVFTSSKISKTERDNNRAHISHHVNSKTNIRTVNRKQMFIRNWKPKSLPDGSKDISRSSSFTKDISRRTSFTEEFSRINTLEKDTTRRNTPTSGSSRRSTLGNSTSRKSTLESSFMKKVTLANRMSKFGHNFDLNQFQSYLQLPSISQSTEKDSELISHPKSTNRLNDSSKATLLKKGLPMKGNLKMTIPKIDYREPDTLPIEPSRKYSEELDHLQDCIEHLQYQRKFMFRTPIKLAAERDHIECVKTILTMRTLTNNSYLTGKGFLVLAAKEASVDAINILIKNNVTDRDLIDAINFATSKLIAESFRPLIRELRKRNELRDAVNMFHAVFEASLKRFGNLTKMVEILIDENEDVNKWNTDFPGTYPLYTLIEKAFLTKNDEQFNQYIECLKLLLENKANQFYNERLPFEDETNKKLYKLKPCRKLYSSAMDCIFDYKYSAKNISSIKMKFRLRRVLELIKFVNDNKKISRPSTCLTQQNELMLFQYLRNTWLFGVDPYVLTFLLNLKMNPNAKERDAYAVNAYFDKLLPNLEPGDVKQTFDRYKPDIDSLIIVCRGMSFYCLNDAIKLFMDKHLFNKMLHVIPLVRYFCYLVDKELKRKEVRRRWSLPLQNQESEVNLPKLADDLVKRGRCTLFPGLPGILYRNKVCK